MYSLVSRGNRCRVLSPVISRHLATTISQRRLPREEGSISSIFTTLTPGEGQTVLPARFTELKRDIFKDELVETWRQVLNELESTVGEIVEKGNGVSTFVGPSLSIGVYLLSPAHRQTKLR
jgi:hypothetical protein